MNSGAANSGGVDPLAALRPLREPDAIGWWPPAPGWWLLAALVLITIVALLCWWLRRRRREAYRRQALLALAQVRQAYSRDSDELACLASINALLKSVALQAFPRRDVASMSGETWRRFLNDNLGEQLFDPALLDAQYRPQLPGDAVNRQFAAAQQWIARHRRRA